MTTPPCVPGLPIVGNLWDYYRNTEPLLRRGYETLGPVFSLRLGPKRAVVLIGPEYHQFFFRETDRKLSVSKEFEWSKAIFGERFPLAAETARHRADRPVLHKPLMGRALRPHAGAFAEETAIWLDSLGDRGQFDVVDAAIRITMWNAIRGLVGRETRLQFGDEFRSLLAGLARAASDHLLRGSRLRLKNSRRDRAKQHLGRIVQTTIDSRRAGVTHEQDFLKALLEAEVDGAPIPDADIIDLGISFIWAGHATLAGHLSWTLIQLLQHPEYLKTVREELFSVSGESDEALPEQLPELRRLEWAIRETERLRPSVLVIGRVTLESYEAGGYEVPRGWLTFISPAVAHRLPEIFPHPDAYDPERFAPGRREHAGKPNSLIGFGGGYHKCVGEDFALLEMKVILSMLLRKFDLRLEHPNPVRRRGPGPNLPQGPVMISYEERKDFNARAPFPGFATTEADSHPCSNREAT